jgi:membrane-associated protein
VNYAIGSYIGPRVFTQDVRFLKREYLDRGHKFFEKHGGKAILLARFVPIMRTFVPFVAGASSMTYPRFVVYNVIGAFAWVSIFDFLGYHFGSIPAVEENFTLVIFGIVILSILPPIIGYLREKRKIKKEAAELIGTQDVDFIGSRNE